MPRPKLTPERRRQNVPIETQVKLLVSYELLQQARARADGELLALRTLISSALADGASIRDVALILGMPPSSVHHLIK